MDSNSAPTRPVHPSAPDYKALLDRVNAALQSFACGELSNSALAQELNFINDEYRALNLLRRMSRTMGVLAAEIARESKNPPPSS